MSDHRKATLTRCGLNANWCVEAWHVGPHRANMEDDGDLYIIDTEDDQPVDDGDIDSEAMQPLYELVRRTDCSEDGDNDIIDSIAESTDFDALVSIAEAMLALNPNR